MSSIEIPDEQRVLILQGGGALGAYDAGVVKALVDELSQINKGQTKKDKPLFNIVAGTSSGAINAAILVSEYIHNNNNWSSAADRLVDYWKNNISIDTTDDIEIWLRWWNEEHGSEGHAASYEAARRYYSAKHLLQDGAVGVFSKPDPKGDDRFFDNGTIPNNIWIQYTNEELRKRLEQFRFPIATRHPQPRLLLVSTNVKAGATVTFDSFAQESEFGRQPKHSGKSEKSVIRYPRGIEAKHVMASSTVPLFYKYEDIDGHKFWDGGLLSNTPLREVLQAHRDYWYKTVGKSKDGSKVPDLEIYIVSVWPNAGDSGAQIPEDDYDAMKEKLYDIQLSDKTEYDEKVAVIVTDYIKIIDEIRETALRHLKSKEAKEAFNKDLVDFLSKDASSKGRDNQPRKYKSLLQGRVSLTRDVTRIECKSDKDSISNKFFDLSKISIERLIDRGKLDAKEVLRKVFKNEIA
jgi:NTE family protein